MDYLAEIVRLLASMNEAQLRIVYQFIRHMLP